ncbi:hypothetical protein BJF86_02405 [Serinicoccus sp. CNJ-927]|uniref:hypothetical protein n=1 Tax=Serinicoccus sp. CNJ-927 TaxID=1904970 RepID=UPI000963811D|nr:hypothetical protein [Serinicoccus sp. CNJ-927]OLT41879.1 hypothetical protein BJF86_02405 [Serinicoccus sp. CNJ-927]
MSQEEYMPTGSPSVAVGPLGDAVRQLWGAAVDSGHYRVVTDAPSDPTWLTQRQFDVVPPRGAPRMMLERGSSRGTTAALLAYRGLRPARPQAARIATAAAVAVRSSRVRPALLLQRHIDHHLDDEPLATVEAAMGAHVVAQVGVRTGANAKATAQLFSDEGKPRGYAKFGWNDLTGGFVTTEADRLERLRGSTGRVRVPGLLARGESFGRPFLVTAPLPPRVHRLDRPDDLGVPELSTLAPLRRRAPAGTSGALTRMRNRAEGMTAHALVAEAAESLRRLLTGIAGSRTDVVLADFDHGDLVPWNTCRDASGTVWAWDWESSAQDVVAGTDALHWFVHALHGPAPKDLAAAIEDAHRHAVPVMRALGMGERAAHVVTSAYLALTVDRSCELALSHGTWKRNRIGSAMTLRLAHLGQQHLWRAEAQP